MKKFLIFLFAIFAGAAGATTVNLYWMVDDENYAQTTCETGGNLILPTPTPTKYGYTFKGWDNYLLSGTIERSGVPSPTNPIYPVFYQKGNLILRALDSAEYVDEFNPATKTITRKVGVRVLTGAEYWFMAGDFYIKQDATDGFIEISDIKASNRNLCLCSHAKYSNAQVWGSAGYPNEFTFNSVQFHLNLANAVLGITDYTQETIYSAQEKIQAYVAAQYANGTPVTLYYPLDEPVTEIWNE